ncbi:MAG: class I SAM-dependent methyltransferase [Veillonellaceae bacterium]|jgi:SAM-dependent methyltransferase|nr:class I SAM-dependent methyltransferase [Veillonellaceae bacterium]
MTGEDVFGTHVTEYEQWFQEHACLLKTEIAAIKEVLPQSGIGLEIGVGSGLFAAALGIKYGVEPSEAMRKKAQSRGVHVFDGVAERLPFKTAMFDFAVMITVDCFLTDVARSFREAYRILVPRGWFIIALIDAATRLGKEYEQKKQSSLFYRQAHFHSAAEIKELLTRAGFCVDAERQTIFTFENVAQEIKPGIGEGVFAVIRARKMLEQESAK